MKYLVIVKPGPMPPPIELIEAARAWVEERRADGTFEAVYAFPEGGGLSIGENDSHEALMEQLLQYPLAPFVQYEVRALVDLPAAFERFQSFAEKVNQQMAAAAS